MHTLDLNLNSRLTAAGLGSLEPNTVARLEGYATLLRRWNERINLTAIRDEAGIVSRHFIESIACARALPVGIASLLDFGSGAGFPGIPIALCRPEIAVTLAESQGKKAAFLREAVRILGLSAKVHSGRAETLESQFDCVTLRAVDRMTEAVKSASRLVGPEGWLALMTTNGELPILQPAIGPAWSWNNPVALPNGDNRVLALGTRLSTPS